MIKIFVKIYSDKSLEYLLSSYRLNFIAVPKVGDLISKNIHIDGAEDCCVEKVIFIPKHEASTDCDVCLKCFETDIYML